LVPRTEDAFGRGRSRYAPGLPTARGRERSPSPSDIDPESTLSVPESASCRRGVGSSGRR